MRSTFGGFFMESGHEGFDDSQGSNKTRLPPGVRTMNVECPSQVIESFCKRMPRIYFMLALRRPFGPLFTHGDSSTPCKAARLVGPQCRGRRCIFRCSTDCACEASAAAYRLALITALTVAAREQGAERDWSLANLKPMRSDAQCVTSERRNHRRAFEVHYTRTRWSRLLSSSSAHASQSRHG